MGSDVRERDISLGDRKIQDETQIEREREEGVGLWREKMGKRENGKEKGLFH